VRVTTAAKIAHTAVLTVGIPRKFPFIEQFNTLKEQPPRLLLFSYLEPNGSFFMHQNKEMM
jgi:hypothetical protein